MKQLAELIGSSPAIEALRDQIRRLIARQQIGHRLPSVLISGETGTGKGLVAHLLHRCSPRAGGPFVPINCAAIPDTLLEAELFGYERGAFTDARQPKPGLFQAAHRGTIFLDEIALLPEGLQAKLLKAIEERAVRRLGGTRSEPFDAWVLSATNTDLALAIRERSFREDLYHRLAVLTLRLPPIRERGTDVVILAEHFLERACADYGLAPRSLSAAARATLMAYSWPGNVRELSNVMERVALLGEPGEVTPEMLALPAAEAAPTAPATLATPTAISLETAMRNHLLEALEQQRWNISRTAAALGISRNTVRARIERFGLREPTVGSTRRTAAPLAGVSAVPAAHPSLPATPVVPVEPDRPAASMSAAAPVRAIVRWERRPLVLLRVALVGPVDGDRLLDTSRVLELLVDKVHSFGGTIEEMSPVSVGAVFGLDTMEEAPRRAAHAAMAMRRMLERGLNGEAPRLAGRIGLHAATLLMAHVGDARRIDADAKRASWCALDALVHAGAPGVVMVTAAAAALLERRFVLVPAAVPAPETQPAFRLVGAERPAIRAGGRLTGFVGRRQELDLLESRFHAAIQGRGQVIGISGEAGIGKSRLLYEFRHRIRGHRIAYLEAHCLSYGTAIPYLPLLQLLRRTFRLDEADTPEAVAGKVRRTLNRLGLPAEEAESPLLELLGIKKGEAPSIPSPQTMQARTRDIIRRMSASASRRRPLIIVVEDLHWIDAASESIGLSLFEGLDTLPIFVLLTYRSGYRQPWMDRSYVTQIALQPLSRTESEHIVSAVLDTAAVPATLTDVMVERAEGNPFFLEELARAVTEQHDADEPRVVPDTIQEVLLARIDRLTPGARRLLETAAVIGRHVSHRLLRASWDDPDSLDDHVRDLVRHEFIYATTTMGGEAEYVFRHALTQEVAYRNLVESTRHRLHGAVGEALEQLHAERLDDVVELLAHHYGRSSLDDRAVDYGILAAEKAARRWANTEARTGFTTVLGRLDRMPRSRENLLRRLDAVLKQSEIRFALGEHRAQLQGLAAVRDIAEQMADPPRRAAWLHWTGFLHALVGGRPEVAVAYCREAVALVEAAGSGELRPFADCCLAHVHLLAGDLRQAMDAGERALSEFEARGNIWWACRTMWALSPTANALGDWARSLRYCGRALHHGERANDLRIKIVAWSRTAGTQVQRGDARAALAACDVALKLGPTPFDTSMINAVRGYALVKSGDAPAGLTMLRDAVEWFTGSHLLYTRSLYSMWLAESLVRSGDRDAGRQVAGGVLETSKAVGYQHLEGVAHRILGESLMADDPDTAADHLQRAGNLLERIGARNELAKTLVSQAILRAARGAPAEARVLLGEARATFEALDTVDEPDRVRAVLQSLPGGAIG